MVPSPLPDTPELVGDLSESALLARFVPLLTAPAAMLVGPGDDCAVLAAPDARVVVSTDVLVEDVHFRREWSSAQDVGRRAAAQNLADAAAIGAVPTGLVVSLVLPRALPVAWVEDLARGLDDGCREWGAGVVGGDLASGAQVVIAVTVLGDLEGRAPVLRSGARPGDVVAHAGVRGRSAAGLALLSRQGAQGGAVAEDPGPVGATVLAAFRAPSPPVAAGRAAAIAGATAMLDVSDGLVRDAGRLAEASGVRLALEDPVDVFADELALLAPIARALDVEAATWVLTGGEDHGMLATFPPDVDLPEGFRVIGRVEAREVDSAGADVRQNGRTSSSAAVTVAGRTVSAGGGWDHFAPGRD
ncbi:thiamine-phosphate kinase [Sanguibacter sp. A247]|uniref:thiamine-phosphate kinase n=1 Tax=unclassified Sanguibacter TaxID=2645534 RepID=UPI003FD778D2